MPITGYLEDNVFDDAATRAFATTRSLRYARATALIGSAIQQQCLEIPLTRRQDGVYVGQASGPDIMRSEFFVAVSISAAESLVATLASFCIR